MFEAGSIQLQKQIVEHSSQLMETRLKAGELLGYSSSSQDAAPVEQEKAKEGKRKHGKARESEKTPGKPLKRMCQTARREAKQDKERDNQGTQAENWCEITLPSPCSLPLVF